MSNGDIGDIAGVLSLILAVFGWLGITPKMLSGSVVKNKPKIILAIQLGSACLYVALIMLIFIFVPIAFHIFSLAWSILAAMVLWSALGVLLPLLEKLGFWNHRLTRFVQLLGIGLFSFALIGFWIFEWPKWETPALVTSMLFVVLIISIVEWIGGRAKRPKIAEPYKTSENPES